MLMLSFGACGGNRGDKTGKNQKHRNNVVNVSEDITDIKTEITFGKSVLYIIDDILIVEEISPEGKKGIHLFNKNTFEFLTSTGFTGRGPGEIVTPGRLGIDSRRRIFWVPDFGKQVIFKFPLDSVLCNEMFVPTEKIEMNSKYLINGFEFLNDTIGMGDAMGLSDSNTLDHTPIKLNIKTGRTEKFGYRYPEIGKLNSGSFFALSASDGIYVNCYFNCDLMTICDLNGSLKHNVYGPGWYDSEKDKKSYFFGADIMHNMIFASYIGSKGVVIKDNKPKGALPTKFIVFDIHGDYLKTVETGNDFFSFCIDEENNRIVAWFDDRAEALGYLNINF